MKKLILIVLMLLFILNPSFSQSKSVFSVYPFCLYNKVKLKYEFKVGNRSSIGTFGVYNYGANFKGPKFEPFFRSYFTEFPLDFYFQFSLFYGKFSSEINYNSNSPTVYPDIFIKSQFASSGFGIGIGNHFKLDKESKRAIDIFIGLRFCSYPLEENITVDNLHYTLDPNEKYSYKTTGPGALLAINVGFCFGKHLKNELDEEGREAEEIRKQELAELEKQRLEEQKIIEQQRKREQEKKDFIIGQGIAFEKLVDEYKSRMQSDYIFKKYDNGDVYIGQMKGDIRNGKGVYIWKQAPLTTTSPDHFDGNWVEGKKEGYGHLIYTEVGIALWTSYFKNEYYGNFKNDKFEGEAKYNGDRCLFENGKLIRNYDQEAWDNKQDQKYEESGKYIDGKFTLPSYKNDEWHNGMSNYTFSDGTEGILYYRESCGLYYVDPGLGSNNYYPDLNSAIKALYVYKKFHATMKGSISCN